MSEEAFSRRTSGVQPCTHFRVASREMLLDAPICCPLYGALSFDGLAIDDQQGVHLVVRTAAARAYLGPDADTVARRAHILAVALVHGGMILPDRAPGIAGWIGQCWSAATDEIDQRRRGDPFGRPKPCRRHRTPTARHTDLTASAGYRPGTAWGPQAVPSVGISTHSGG
jgi:hypothetical protein